MGLPLGKAITGWRICSLQFTNDSYMEPVLTDGGSKLRKDLVPSIIDISENSEEPCETIQNVSFVYCVIKVLYTYMWNTFK